MIDISWPALCIMHMGRGLSHIPTNNKNIFTYLQTIVLEDKSLEHLKPFWPSKSEIKDF